MDETKETNQDTSLQETPPVGSEGTTPKVETFTKEDVDKLIQDDRVARGRDAKSLSEWETRVKSQEEATKAMSVEIERQRLDAQRREIEALADDPEAKKALLHRYDIEERERKHAEQVKKDEAKIQKMFNDATALATEYNLNPSDLLSAGNPEAMKLLAKNLALERQINEKPKVDTPTEPKEGFTPDSGTNDAGTDSDEAFLKGWNSGEIPATKENIARADKIIKK